MAELAGARRRKPPKELAVIDPDRCTGCGACVEVCPAQCIGRNEPYPDTPGLLSWCEVDWDRCIGCRLCVRVPGKESDPYTLVVCPWSAIEMVPMERLREAVEQIGGPPEMAEANRQRLLAVAQRQMQSARGTGSEAER
jgi:electron transport complex protein RnfB